MAFPIYPKDERQQKIIEMAQNLAQIFAQRALQYDWEANFPYENYKDLHRSGYLTLTVPEEFGGWGASLLETALAQFYLAQGDASTSLVMSMHLANVAKLRENLTDSSKLFSQICHDVAEQGAIINTAASEPATGSPSRGGLPTTSATRQPDGSWIINGHKTYTTGAPVLQYFLTTCAIEDTPASTDLTPIKAKKGTFAIPRSTPGLRVEETWNSLGMRTSGSHDFYLDNVHVPATAYVEGSIPSNPVAQDRLAAWTFPNVAVYLGISQAARDEAIRFASRRKPNSLDQPISSLPHIQEKAGQMDSKLLQSKAVFFGIAEQAVQDASLLQSADFAAAKYIVTNNGLEIVDTAMRLVGGASLSMAMPLQRYYRDIRAGLHNPPMDDATLSLVAKQAFEQDQR